MVANAPRAAGPRPIDAHVHIFSPEIVADREPFLAADGWFGQLYAKPTARLATADDLIGSMDAAGIEISVVCGFPWRDAGRCDDQNAVMAEAARRFPHRIRWLAIVNPALPGAAGRAADWLATGASGVGELNADAQGFALDDPRALPAIAEVTRAAGKPLLLHTSEPVGHRYPGKGSATPDRILSALELLPATPVVLAHWGGGLPFYELMPEVHALTRHVVYDSAASTYLYRFDIFRTVVGLAGADRVMFATDYPVLRQTRFLERVQELERDEQVAGAILSGNARRVFGIATEEPA